MKNLILIIMMLLSLKAFSSAVFDKNQYNKLNITDMGFRQACAAGLVKGCSVIRKFGINNNLTSGVKRDIWEYGSAAEGNVDYTYPADGTAPINTISSSSTLDTQKIGIFGLDINGKDVYQEVTLNGQNKVTLSIPLWRSYRAFNLDTQTTADRSIGFNGEVYLYEDTAIVTGVPVDVSKVRLYLSSNNQTQMTNYTIPDGYIGYYIGASLKFNNKNAATIVCQVWVRSYNGTFAVVDTVSLNNTGTGAIVEDLFIPAKLTSKTDVLLTAEADANGAGVTASYTILLLEKAVFGVE